MGGEGGVRGEEIGQVAIPVVEWEPSAKIDGIEAFGHHQAADSAGTLETAAEVEAPGVAAQWDTGGT